MLNGKSMTNRKASKSELCRPVLAAAGRETGSAWGTAIEARGLTRSLGTPRAVAEIHLPPSGLAPNGKGSMLALGGVEELRRRARRRVEVWFEGPPPTQELATLPGLVDPHVDDHRFVAVLAGPIQPLLEVLARHAVVSLLVEEPDLEEAFLDLYEAAS